MIFMGGGGCWKIVFEKKKSRTEFCSKKNLGQGKFYCTYCVIYVHVKKRTASRVSEKK